MKAEEADKASARWYIAAGALLTGGPVWRYLYVSGYALTRVEFFVLPILAALIGMTAAYAAYRLGAIVGPVVFGLLIMLFLDLQFLVSAWPVRGLALAIVCIFAALLLRRRVAVLSVVVLLTFYATSLPQYGNGVPHDEHRSHATVSGHEPLLVHLVLDEQWGIGGLRAAGDTVLADYLTRFYYGRGFQVYEAAYSRAPNTRSSLPLLVGLGQRPALEKGFDRRTGPTHRLLANPYFAELRKRGYEIAVFQSTYMDYCHGRGAAVTSCNTAVATSVANVGDMRGTWTERALIAGRLFLNLESGIYDRARHDGLVWRRTFAGRGLRQLDEIRGSIASSPARGKAIFAHVLLPHRPLEVGANCEPGKRIYRPMIRDTAAFRKAFMPLYRAQVLCLHQSVGEIIDAIDERFGREGAVVVIHGDHGSRFKGDVDDWAALHDQNLSINFSTLLAIRGPGIPAGVRSEPVPLQDFFWAFARSGFAETPTRSWQHYVVGDFDKPVHRADTLRQLDPAKMAWARHAP